MANAASLQQCCFQWNIYNPFLPWRSLEATFYHGSPTATQWKATLQSMERRINYWNYSFSLEFDEWFDPLYEITADRVLIVIRLNGALIARKEVRHYCFCRGNRFKYYFQSFHLFFPQLEPHHLDIRIEITLPGEVARNEPGNGLFTDEDDLQWLSRDMKQLLDHPQYSNIHLLPRNGQQPILAHSYILDARWNNFFKLHAFTVGAIDTVNTNISGGLLSDILTYMYSGTLARKHWPDWTDAAYSTELFQVIDRYKLYHLYKVFVKNDLQQVRETRNPTLIESHLFPLYCVNGRSINNASHTWHVNSNPEYELIFQIRLRNRTGNWLSYSLQSKSPSRVYARVSLEVVTGDEGKDLPRVVPFHERECAIDPEATVESRRVLFLGCPETFSALEPTSSDGAGTKFFIRCFLNVTNGTTVLQVQSVGDEMVQNDSVRFSVLSDHMHKLRRQPTDEDMLIVSRSFGPGVADPYQYQGLIHKEIFASRIPDCWEGLENVLRENGVPDFAAATLSYETLPIVLDYLYTGKVFTIPTQYLHEIEDFAQRTMFYSLLDVVNRIRSRWIDR